LEHLPPKTWTVALEEMFRVARKQVILAFFIALKKGGTASYMRQAAWGIFWGHKYSEEEIVSYLEELGAKEVNVTRGIGWQNMYKTWMPPEDIIVAVK